MLVKLRQGMAQEEAGFSLVELLVVVVIMGLLAAIAIPAFFSQRDKARDAEAKVYARTAENAAETIATDNNGQYNGANGVTVANMQRVEPTLNQVGGNLVVNSATATSYEIQVTSATGNVFKIARSSQGVTSFPCTTAGTAGCP